MDQSTGAKRRLLLAFAFATAAPLLLAACDSYLERKDLERELRLLLEQRALLEQSLQRATGGKTSGFTDQEKAAAGPIWIELQGVNNRIAAVQARLREL